jgi:aminopeptidase N
LLIRLAAHGRVGTVDIDVELARDDTSAGRRHAAAARAALPSSNAKQQVWHLVVERADTHNAEISAMIGGFQQANQLAELAPYVDRYFDAIGDVWAHRTGDTARTIAEGLFPYLIIEQSTIDRVDEYLRDAKPPAGLRRILLENRDAIGRALRARARDAAAAQA